MNHATRKALIYTGLVRDPGVRSYAVPVWLGLILGAVIVAVIALA